MGRYYLMKSININTDTKYFKTKDLTVLTINEEPRIWERPDYKNKKLIQDHQMMLFQQKVMMYIRGKMRFDNVDVIKNSVTIEIEIHSSKSLEDFSIELIVKTILDSLNKNVLDDDSLIENLNIFYKRKQKRIYDKFSDDNLYICITELITNKVVHVDFSIELIEKKNAIPYDIEGEVSAPHNSISYQNDIYNDLDSGLTNVANVKYKEEIICHMMFETQDNSKDIDNMMLMYLPVLERIFTQYKSQVISIHLYKREPKSNPRTVINLLLK